MSRITLLAGAVGSLLLLGSCSALSRKPLRVCADPNNLPFSNRAGAGFENKLAELVATDLHRPLQYVWWAQRRGYVRNTLNAAQCDLWPGVASTVDMMATTRPYYRSTYVFVTRRSAGLRGLTLDDPRLRKLRIGVQMIGDDGMNTPPAHALARREIIDNVRGYMVYGDYREANPPSRIVRAVADGEIDVALAWGPVAEWYARTSTVPLRIEPVTPWLDQAQWPMTYDISMGVQKHDQKLRASLDAVLARRRSEIAGLLASYGVPLVQ
jgi:mxaJ protein